MATRKTRSKTRINKDNVSTSDDISSILSITSVSPDWNAVFYDSKGVTWFEKIACFALCNKSGINFVGSVIAKSNEGLSIAEDCPNFLGVSPPEDESSWDYIARKKLKLNGKKASDDDSELDNDDNDELENDEDELENEDEDPDPDPDLDNEPQVVSRRKSVR